MSLGQNGRGIKKKKDSSDIDIMILVDLRNEALHSYLDPLLETGFRYNAEHDVWIMRIIKNIEHFRHWVAAYPFYKNVLQEGVALYETA